MDNNFEAQFKLDFLDEIRVDLFAGGGGASTGIEMGLDMPVDIAINHDLEHFINNPIAVECTCDDAQEAIKFYLHNRMVKVSKGQPASLDEIMQRTEMWARLQRKLNIPDIQAYALEHSISDDDHCMLKGVIPVEYQYDMFSALTGEPA